MIKFKVPVKGMHCRSCELLIEDSLKEIDGITKVHASTKEKSVAIESSRSISKQEIASKIRKAGYEVGADETPVLSKDKQTYLELLTAGLILFTVYLIGSKFGVLKYFGSTTSTGSSLPVVFTIGLTAGLSTCMALVGGLILGVSARHVEKHPEATTFQKFRPHLFFNLGRVLSYFILGGIIGQLGSVFKLSGTALGIITIVVGIIMLYMGLGLIDIFPGMRSGPTLPKFITNLFKIKGRENREYSHKNAFILGALTFFLPCGFTQAMQVLAISSGNFFSGAMIMGVFALGTTPGLLTIGGLTSFIKKGYFARLFFKFVGLVVIALSLFNFSNGLNLTGLKSYLVSSEVSAGTESNVKEENGVQVIKMDQISTGYKPNKFVIKKDIPVKWIITSKDISTCASSLIVPKLGIQKVLRLGENIIEFTPKSEGKIMFTCSMGMYSGSFTVTSDGSSSGSDQGYVNQAPVNAQPQRVRIFRFGPIRKS
jgi:sulfite exporter TauE/SafE/copper chaperone CopZ